jgi:hypothetical protein
MGSSAAGYTHSSSSSGKQQGAGVWGLINARCERTYCVSSALQAEALSGMLLGRPPLQLSIGAAQVGRNRS